MIRHLARIVVFLALAGVSCGVQTLTSGGTGSETVIGRVLTSSGGPVRNAAFHLRRTDYLSELVEHGGNGDGFADGKTDTFGLFTIDGVPRGSYWIEVNDGTSGAVLFDCVVDGKHDTSDVGSGPLQPFAAIAGHINITALEGANLFAQVRGLERLAEVAADGKFMLSGLPQGSFDIHIVSTDLSITPFEMSGVRVYAGDTTVISMDPAWHFTKQLYLNTTATGANVTQDVYNFPLLVRLDSSNFDFSTAQPSGGDVRFAKADGTPLPYEIEEFDAARKSAALWVKVDTVHGNSGAQSITLLWGNSSAPNQSNGAAVFDTAEGFAGVWHLGGASVTERLDATAYHNNGSTVGYDGDESRPGCIGYCDSLDNTDDAIMVGDSAITTSLTLGLWMRMTAYVPWGHLIAKPLNAPNIYPWMAYGLQIDSGDSPHFTFTISTDSGSLWVQSQSTVPLQQWVFVTGTYDGSNLRIYYNGTLERIASLSGTIVHNALKIYIGSFDNGQQRFCGKIDEVRISNRALSPSWIKLCYENQKIGSAMVEATK
jgi:hypothetical protein